MFLHCTKIMPFYIYDGTTGTSWMVVLNISRLAAETQDSGSLFQVMIVLGKNEYLYTSTLVGICVNFMLWLLLVDLITAVGGRYDTGIAIRQLTTLYRMVTSATALRCWRLGHFRSLIISLTLDGLCGFQGLFFTHLAAFL